MTCVQPDFEVDADPALDPIPLLVELLRTPSPSGDEAQAAAVHQAWARGAGLHVTRDDAAVRIEVCGREPGPTLVLASHLDTVPPGDGWSVDPYAAELRGDILMGRGAVDAKASVAAMSAAVARVAHGGGPIRGRLVMLATYGEETRYSSMPKALERLGGRPDAAVVGEPTSLRPCVAQRGLLVLRLVWTGEQLHAGWVADRDPKPTLAISLAAPDLVKLTTWVPERVHPSLGQVTVTPTVLNASVARNVTPGICEAYLDIRTTPAYSHDEIVAAIKDMVTCKVEVISDRFPPTETPSDSPLFAAFQRLRDTEPFASPTASDWVFFRGADAIKLGPGDSRLSHTCDEHINVSEVQDASELYAALCVEYLS